MLTSLAAARRAAPAALCALFLLVSGSRADEWTTYAHPNDLKGIALAGDTLWIAGTGGALRFVPATGEFRQFTRRVAGGPLSQDLTSVCADSVSGLVFFGSGDRGVSEYSPTRGRWRRFEFVPGAEINNVVVVGDAVYVATRSGFAVRLSATRTDICNEVDRSCCGDDPGTCDFPSFDVRDFARQGDRLWAATAAGPAEFDGVRWRARTAGADVEDAGSVAAYAGEVFVATPGYPGVYRWNPAAVRWEGAGEGLRVQQLGDLARLVPTGGRLYLACEYGLFEWTGGRWTGTGLENHRVRGVAAVPGGGGGGHDLFAATRDGLFGRRTDGSAWDQFAAPGHPQNISGQAVTAGGDGVIWIGTLGGVMSRTPEGVWASFLNDADTTHAALRPFEVFSLFADSRARVWVGKCCCKSPPKCPTQFIDDGVVSPPVHAYDGWGMAEDAAARLWIGSNVDGVHVLDAQGNQLINLTPANTGVLRSTSVRAVAAEGDRVWLGHEDQGLQILKPGADPANPAGFTWRTLTGGSAQLPDAAISDIAVQGSDVWVLTSGNLVRYRAESNLTLISKQEQIRLDAGGVPRRGNAVVVDRRGIKWVATNDGVLKVTPAGVVSVLDTRNSDLIADEVLDAAVDPQSGDVLFETRIGLSRLKPGSGSTGGDGTDLHLYPNPFLPGIAPGAGRVRVGGGSAAGALVTDLLGRPVARFDPAEGWDGAGRDGKLVAPGLYLVVIDGQRILRLAVIR